MKTISQEQHVRKQALANTQLYTLTDDSALFSPHSEFFVNLSIWFKPKLLLFNENTKIVYPVPIFVAILSAVDLLFALTILRTLSIMS